MAPWPHGVGFGYYGRALALAEELTGVGHDVVFAADTREQIIEGAGYRVSGVGARTDALPDMGTAQGNYVSIIDLDMVFAMARYYHAARIRTELRQFMALLEAERPDLLVVDMACVSALAGAVLQIPVVSIGDSDFFRNESRAWMPWAGNDVRNPYPSCVPAFNEVLAEHGLPAIRHVSDLLWGDLSLIASTPGLEAAAPALDVRGEMEFIGPLYWDPPDALKPQDLAGFGEERIRVYVTLGHGGKYRRDQLETVVAGALSTETALLVAEGFRPPPGCGREDDAGLRTVGFAGLRAALDWADVVISHGGYSTVLAGLERGVPSAVVPFMSEQEANARLFLEAMGSGFLLRRHRGTRDGGFQGRYADEAGDGWVSEATVRRAVGELATDDGYRRAALAASREIREHVARRDLPTRLDAAAGGR